MSLPLDAVQGLLLDLLAPERPVDPARLEALDDGDWERIQAMVRDHRLAPLLHWRLTHEHAGLPVPAAVAEALAQAFRAGLMRGLGQQRDLLTVHRLLDAAGIPHVALKGAYLALHAYPNPALRPLRDIDILVPVERTIEAFQVLVAGGCTRPPGQDGDLEANLLTGKHLPMLRAPGATGIEVHARLYTPGTPGSAEAGGDEAGIWQRLQALPLGPEQLTYMGVADLMLHLVIHAAYDHQFDNGPLTFSDIGYLLQRQQDHLDWPLFWSLAQRSGTRRGALLVLHMVQHFMPSVPVAWPDDLDSGARADLDRQARDAVRLTLRDMASRKDVNLETRLRGEGGLAARLRLLWAKVFLPRAEIAKAYPVSAASPLVYAWYLPKWYRLATRRAPAYLASRRNARAATESQRLRALGDWLDGGRR
ncbi:nucleotidyltransferase domain-containing protein [Zavarzinia sp. CC-PAN008]|uniref:nucleotidyltransferase domain-containing protein n=1 Tax=Zavarzinia sp. CC-PAN008 TaxID=3243332 RepID=UPI003F7467FB